MEETKPSQPFRRKIIVVKRLMQTKYVSLVFLTSLFTALIILLDVAYIISKLLSKQMEGELLSAILADGALLLAIHLPVFFLIVIVISVFISHGFAGPLFRLEKVAESVASGDLSVRVHLRTGDELFETAEYMNKMIDSLREKMLRQKNLSNRISERLEEVLNSIKSNNLSTPEAVRILKELQLELEHIGADFKLQ